ncbi:LysM peptidoglycan-binding domain-containing protein [uncultured Tenacibaculum sp.]|uniref:LysM peptidoglycan-binding domain-containing protein n=1 Tax=uncultured Tenacibaculum sp. TaxID=174713 RepID=UPI00261252A4|nr:LysM peptidoglycan-binding domain-containing protein [uncultured Tenacibaculum sp.]
MINTVTVSNNQSLFDIAIQTTGIATNALAIAQENGLSTTDNLTVGSVLTIPDDVVVDTTIKNYYNQQNLSPASGLTKSDEGITQGLQGIGYWIIGSSFRVEKNAINAINLDDVDISISDGFPSAKAR